MPPHPSNELLGADLLGKQFSRQFDMLLAQNDAERARIFDVRFRVFCEELGYSMANRDNLESDAYDNSSLHCLVHHRASQTDIGCVRVVLPKERGGGLPFESFGMRYVDRKLLDWNKLDPTKCCELSRLAILDEFRRVRPASGSTVHEDGSVKPDGPSNALSTVSLNTSSNFSSNAVTPFQERRRAPQRMPPVALALYQATIALTLQNDFEHVFMVGEPRLQRHVLTYGIHMRQVSPTFEYFGQRAVFVTSRADTLATVEAWNADKKDLYRFVHARITGKPAQMASDPDVDVMAV